MRDLTRRQTLQGLAGAMAAAALSQRSIAGSLAASPGDLVRFAWWTDVGVPTPFQISTAGPGGTVLLPL